MRYHGTGIVRQYRRVVHELVDKIRAEHIKTEQKESLVGESRFLEIYFNIVLPARCVGKGAWKTAF